MANANASHPSTSPSSHPHKPLPFRDVLLQHITLSRQVSQALFSSIQSSYSTALPPDPIPRPDNLAKELSGLPIWSLQSSPTSKELIPSLLTIHDSLDELLLKARTHRENVRKIKALKEETEQLQIARRERIKKLRNASLQLRDVVAICDDELVKVQRARHGETLRFALLSLIVTSLTSFTCFTTAPINYKDVLAYASDLARNTSAPPGWSGSNRLLQQRVTDAMQLDADEPRQRPPSTDTPNTVKSNTGEYGGAGTSAKPSPKVIDDLNQSEESKPRPAPFTNPEESGPSATSAPHSLPFPSDADMRRGLLGIAMLEDHDGKGPDFASVIPTWRTWAQSNAQAVTDVGTDQQQDALSAQQPNETRTAVKRERPSDRRDDAAEAGFGLDLN